MVARCVICDEPGVNGAEHPLCERHLQQLRRAIELNEVFGEAAGDHQRIDNWESRYRENIGYCAAWGSAAGVTRGKRGSASATQLYYRRLRQAWKCYGCRADLDIPMSRCRACRRQTAEYKRGLYCRDRGRRQCHKCQNPALPGSVRCQLHAEAHRAQQRARRDRLVKEGLCCICGRNRKDGTSRRCVKCKHKRKESRKSAVSSNGARQELNA